MLFCKYARFSFQLRFGSTHSKKNAINRFGLSDAILKSTSWGDENVSDVLLKEIARNWRKEWWKYSVLQQPEALALQEIIEEKNECSLMEKFIKFHEKICGKTDKHFMVAATTSIDNEICLKYGLFSKCDASKHASFVHEWARRQPRLFKRFYFDPDKIILDNAGANNGKCFLLKYNHNNESTILQSSKELKIDAKSFKNIHATLAMVHLNNLSLSTVRDAFLYREQLQKNRPSAKLMLNNRLAPIKCFVKPQDENAADEVQNLANEICIMLRTKNIGCLSHNEHNKVNEIGVPFTLLMPNNVAQTGIVFLHDISTGINMEVTVPEIDEIVLKYLDLN